MALPTEGFVVTIGSRTKRNWSEFWASLAAIGAFLGGLGLFGGFAIVLMGGGNDSASPRPPTTSLFSSFSTRPGTVEPFSSSEPRTVRIDNAPPDGLVSQCWRFRGTANLQNDEVLVLGVQNLADPAKYIYFQTVTKWDGTPGKSSWSRRQYFGSDNSSVNQKYWVYAVVAKRMAYEAARAAHNARDGAWRHTAVPDGARVEQTLLLQRRPGSGSSDCFP